MAETDGDAAALKNAAELLLRQARRGLVVIGGQMCVVGLARRHAFARDQWLEFDEFDDFPILWAHFEDVPFARPAKPSPAIPARKSVSAPGTGTAHRVVERLTGEVRSVRELGADLALLGQEGVDDDGDGRVNEDEPGEYDLNRNWPSGWQPEWIQFGAGDFPLSHPEPAHIARFLLAHPNVAAVQSFHNSGGMILRGPGTQGREGLYPREDREVYDAIARDGEAMLPFYRSMVIWKDLYEVHGGFVNWCAEGLGIVSFTNELWSGEQYFAERGEGGLEFADGNERRLKFDDLLLFGETWVDWHPVPHPKWGTVEVGGFRKMTGRVPPPFMIQEMLHRNAAFCVFHASQMPRLAADPPEVADAILDRVVEILRGR